MDLNQLELMEIIARTGSLSRAAADLGTSQPRLTQQLQSIEKELGASLFHRSARGLILSEAGSTFLPFVRQIRSAFERGQSAISEMSKKRLARLRLGISFTTSTRMASEFLQEFHKRHVDVHVTLIERNPHDLVAGLESGELDLCGGLELPETTTLVRKQIFSTRLVGIAAASMDLSSRISLGEFCRRPLALTSRKCATRIRLDDALKRAGVKPTICMELDDANTILHLVRAGAVVSIIPETLTSGVRACSVHKLSGLDVPVTGYFLFPRNPTTEAQDFMATILERIAPRIHG